MLMKTEDAIYEEINKTLVFEKDKLEKSKTQYFGEINELDNRKDWINWITQYGDDGIEYLTDKKSDGYNVVNGKNRLDIGILEIQKGGRRKTAKKNHRI